MLSDPSSILGILEDARDSAGVVAALLGTGGWGKFPSPRDVGPVGLSDVIFGHAHPGINQAA